MNLHTQTAADAHSGRAWLILVVGVCLLIVPFWALSLMDTEQKKLAAISLLIVRLVSLLAIGARNCPGDILAAAATSVTLGIANMTPPCALVLT